MKLKIIKKNLKTKSNKPPLSSEEELKYSNVSWAITSIIGATTAFLF